MVAGLLFGFLALLLAACAAICYTRRKSTPCVACAVFAVATMAWGAWVSHDAALGLPRSKFHLKVGETYEATDGFVFNQQLYKGLIPQHGGEMRLYRFNHATPPRFVVEKGDGVDVEFRYAPAPRK